MISGRWLMAKGVVTMNGLLRCMAAGVSACLTAATASAAVMMGAHVGVEGAPNALAEYQHLETQIGRPLAIDSDYAEWAGFPDTQRIQWDLQTGHLPMQTWRVTFQYNNPNACATAAAIIAGTYDTQLQQQAAAVKALGSTILVRFNPEMTTNLYDPCFAGFPVKQNLSLAGKEYIAAWKHVVDLFRTAGATNVKWVWAPGAPTYAQGIWYYFYPGSDYVDWIAVDVYNNVGDTPADFATWPGLPSYEAAIPQLGKPMMISETAAFNDPAQNPDPQTVWVNSARDFLKMHPEITAFIWWDSSTHRLPPPPYDGSGFRLNGAGLAAFKSMANDPYFKAPGL
jgi:hypothetical protein